MPSVVNGFGTWYYGKRRIHRVKAVCSQCNALTELESYDTTLYIVAAMIPIAPIGQKRILEQCQSCRRHRVLPLNKWESAKAEAFNDVLEKLQANPDDKPTIQAALGMATSFQDVTAFDKLADVLGDRCEKDADIQAQLGSAYEYFSRWPEAEKAYARSLALQPNDEISERLAVCLLKQNRPEEAIDYISHVFVSKNSDKAWLTFWLIEGYMAKGLHEQALELMDARDQAFPSLVNEKSYKQQRRTAEKHKSSGKPIPSKYLTESSKTGYKEGSGLGFKWPRYVAAAIFLGLLSLYLGSAWYKGRHRPVYLANGWKKPYAVKINGQEHQLQPGAVKKIELPEGDVTVEWPEGGEGPQTARIQTSFFGRPFNRPVFVINPDRFALLEREQAVYSQNPNASDNADSTLNYSAGKLLHRFDEVNYEFQPFPAEIQVDSGGRVKKTRVGLLSTIDTADRLFDLSAAVSANEQLEYVKRFVQLDPDDLIALGWMTSQLSKADAIAFLKPRLADRPIRVEWHRRYQTMTELNDPSADLRPEYRRLVDQTKRAPEALYLLGRLEDGAAAEMLYLEAVKAENPSAYACAALSYRYLVRGDFDTAVTWSKKAIGINASSLTVRRAYLEVLLGAGKYKELLVEAGKDPSNRPLLIIHNKLAAMLALGDKAGADMEIARVLGSFNIGADNAKTIQLVAEFRAVVDSEMALAQRDREKYLALAAQGMARDPFSANILKGDPKAAAGAAADQKLLPFDWEAEASRAGLLYLAAQKKKDAALADEQWKKLGEALSHGDREARRLGRAVAGKEPFDAVWVRDSIFHASLKRVLLSALARKYPAHAATFIPLAKKLDFDRDSTSLCLRYVME